MDSGQCFHSVHSRASYCCGSIWVGQVLLWHIVWSTFLNMDKGFTSYSLFSFNSQDVRSLFETRTWEQASAVVKRSSPAQIRCNGWPKMSAWGPGEIGWRKRGRRRRREKRLGRMQRSTNHFWREINCVSCFLRPADMDEKWKGMASNGASWRRSWREGMSFLGSGRPTSRASLAPWAEGRRCWRSSFKQKGRASLTKWSRPSKRCARHRSWCLLLHQSALEATYAFLWASNPPVPSPETHFFSSTHKSSTTSCLPSPMSIRGPFLPKPGWSEVHLDSEILMFL